jgi:predicted aspartyl protease
MIYTYNYDSDYPFGPAMPMVDIQVRPVGGEEASIAIQAVVDYGADATILPVDFLVASGLKNVGRARMRWGDHQGRVNDVYLAVIQIGELQIPGIRVLADERNQEPILGRDVLNQWTMTLNGPANVVEISTG